MLNLIFLVLLFLHCQKAFEHQVIKHDALYTCFQNGVLIQKLNQFPYITHPINQNQSDVQNYIAISLNQAGMPAKILKDTAHTIFYNSSIFYKSFMYVMHFESKLEFQEKLYKIKNSVSWNPSAKFWLIVPKFSDDLFKFAFKQLWLNYAVDVVILYRTEKGVNIVTWFPYDKDCCGEFVGKLYVINKCNKDGKLLFDKEIFPNKIPKDLKGCPVKVLYLRWLPAVIDPMSKGYPGYEVEIMQKIAQTANITLVYIPLNITKLGDRTYKGNWTELLGAMQVSISAIKINFILLY